MRAGNHTESRLPSSLTINVNAVISALALEREVRAESGLRHRQAHRLSTLPALKGRSTVLKVRLTWLAPALWPQYGSPKQPGLSPCLMSFTEWKWITSGGGLLESMLFHHALAFEIPGMENPRWGRVLSGAWCSRSLTVGNQSQWRSIWPGEEPRGPRKSVQPGWGEK